MILASPGRYVVPFKKQMFLPRAPLRMIRLVGTAVDSAVVEAGVEIIQYNTMCGDVSAGLSLAILAGLPQDSTVAVSVKETFAVVPANEVVVLVTTRLPS